jgi:hypothetical protein
MDPARFTRVDPTTWRIEPHGAMRVRAIIYADENLIRDMDDKVFEQAVNVATLPGIVQASYAMPDAHWGYGFPIGGVAAFDPDHGGVVSAGGVGFDISCGVRTMLTGLTVADMAQVQKSLADSLFRQIPAGVGSKGAITLDATDMDAMLLGGAHWAVERGWGNKDDLERIEEKGMMAGARPEHVSDRAKERQRREMGTLGSGNHYLEVQAVTEIFDAAVARVFGLAPNDVVVTIHCGSRGLGHQIGTEFLKEMVVTAEASGIVLPDRELACAPINSEVGQRYLGAMRAAINCAPLCAARFRALLSDVRAAPTIRCLAQYLQGRKAFGRWQTARAVRSPEGCHPGLRARSREPARGASSGRSASANRRQHGHGLVHSGGRGGCRGEIILVSVPRRRPCVISSQRPQALERAQDRRRPRVGGDPDPQSLDTRRRRGGAWRL